MPSGAAQPQELSVQSDPFTAIFAFIVLISVIVVVHELGHYLAGRVFGAGVKSFAVGFGPTLVQRRDRNGTDWKVCAFPLGGYVAFVDEQPGEPPTRPDVKGKSFRLLSPLQRIVVAAAGPFSNFVFAALVFGLLTLGTGQRLERLVIGAVNPGSPAEAAGMQAGDILKQADGKPLRSFRDLIGVVQLRTDTPVEFVVDRGGEALTLTAVPVRQTLRNQLGIEARVGTIGISIAPREFETVRHGPLASLWIGVVETGETLNKMADALWRVVTLKEPLEQMSGPAGIADIAGRVVATNADAAGRAELGLLEQIAAIGLGMVSLAAVLSVGVGLFNLLPLPVLDGGHIAYSTFELLTGKPVSERIQATAGTISMAFLLGMAVMVTWFDIQRITAP